MIANVSIIVYIISTCEQHISNKILQTGSAACKIDGDGNFTTFRYTLWLPLNDAEPEDTEDAYIRKFTQESVYFITGKFTMLDNGLLELIVSSCKELPIEKDKIPVCKPIVFLLGRVKKGCTAAESGYYLTLEVKPYLTADMSGPVDIVLTHPLNGRLKNIFTASKTTSLIQCTAELYIIENKLYGEAIEMQFINIKSESSNSVPWPITSKDRKKNSVESRIAAVHESMQKQPPTPAKVKTETTIKEKGTAQKPIKVDDIARSTIKRKRGKATSGSDEDSSEAIVITNEVNTDNKLLKNNSGGAYSDEEVPRPKRGRPRRKQ